MSHVFGPVPSRRLGRSLGVDLVPYKTCSYDCIYCQLGTTTDKTVERREYVPLDAVLRDIKSRLSSQPDYITLSGSGEPTLYSRLGELIDGIKTLTDIPVAVLTNGSLFQDPEVRHQVAGADLVVPSLDAGSSAVFQAVNRPHPSITFDAMVDGLISFRHETSCECWLEVFILGGYTSVPDEAHRLADLVRQIKPHRVQLNTVTRPPADDLAVAVEAERLEEIATWFDPVAEVVADYRGTHDLPEFGATRAEVLSLIRRRPCSLDDIVNGLSSHRNEIVKYVEELTKQGLIIQRRVDKRLYYSAAGSPDETAASSAADDEGAGSGPARQGEPLPSRAR